ncbi:SRA-YDG [Suillus paluster]|uniref:SRA-YDG n=1 Tax=Suillus paluster TaxID=48578 RepID=UPI001B874D82|nr:SRA-YDG [Suillus paluster]KAG1749153.1 SRA-YDG [Suillus paluster]
MTLRDGRTFGHVSGVAVGATFPTRDELFKAGVHVVIRRGIHGDQELGAFSICLSAGYEDNVDNGNTMHVSRLDFLAQRTYIDVTPVSFSIYVGSGEQEDGNQIRDQSFDHAPNKALLTSFETKRPVRVVRGPNEGSFYSPSTGFRYDGLYVVDEAKEKDGKKGFKMCTFKLSRIEEEGQKEIPTRRKLTPNKLAKMAKKARLG